MNHALLVKDENYHEVVFIDYMETFGKEYARSCCYVCPDQNCNVIMRPVFPDKQRKKGKEVHSSHFRAQPQKHRTGCKAIKDKAVIVTEAVGGKNENKIYDIVKRSPYPVHYTNPKRRTSVSEDGTGSTENTHINGGQKAGGISPKTRDTHISEPQSNSVRRFAEAFEDLYEHRRTMKFKLDGCPARNYDEGFFRLTKNESRHLDKLAVYIYFGRYISHTFKQSGTSVLFGVSYVNHKKVGVWIQIELHSEALWNILFERLEKAASRADVTVYVAGRFINRQNWKYSIEIKDLHDLWISFPEDRSERSNYE